MGDEESMEAGMRLPVSWLKDFVELTLPIEEIASLLTFSGLEVEEIEIRQRSGDFDCGRAFGPS